MEESKDEGSPSSTSLSEPSFALRITSSSPQKISPMRATVLTKMNSPPPVANVNSPPPALPSTSCSIPPLSPASSSSAAHNATAASTASSTTSSASSTSNIPSQQQKQSQQQAQPQRNKRQELSFADRIQVIMARKSGKSMRQLAVQFGCGKTQILNILGQREAYLREWEEKAAESNPHISSRKRRSRRTGNEETNRLVWEWYGSQKDLGIRVTGPMLQREARSIARGLGISNFAASNGWLDSFRRLHNIGPQSRRNVAASPTTSKSTDDVSRQDATASSDTSLDLFQASTSGTSGGTMCPPTNTEDSYQEAPGFASENTFFHPPPDRYYQYRPPEQQQQHSSGGGLVSVQSLDPSRMPDQDDPLHVQQQYESDRSSGNGISMRENNGNGRESFKHFANMAAVFQDHPLTGYSSASVTSHHQDHTVSGPPHLLPAYSALGDEDDNHFVDQFSLGARIHSSSSNSINSQPFSPQENIYPIAIAPSSNGSRPPTIDFHHQQNIPGVSSSHHQDINQPVALRPALVIQNPRSLLVDSLKSPPTIDLEEDDTYCIPQQQQRQSVLVSTRTATAAAAAAAAAAEAAFAATGTEDSRVAASTSTSSPAEPTIEEKRRRMMQLQNTLSTTSSSSPSSPSSFTAASLQASNNSGFFGSLATMASVQGLISIEYNDDRGEGWMEIRPPPTATFRVPFYGYRTHLMRLIVDRNLSYWLEALGQCVRSGTFRSLTRGGLDVNIVQPVLDLLAGGATVCQGRGSVLKRVHQFHPRSATEQGMVDGNYFTLPDYRYRSYDCFRLVDGRSGQAQCPACSLPPEPFTESDADVSSASVSTSEAAHPPNSRYSPSEPLNLSLTRHEYHQRAPPVADFGIIPVSSFSTSLYSAGQRLLESVPDAHNQFFRASRSDQDPDDFRLAREAAYLSLSRERERERGRSHSCCGEWNPEEHSSSSLAVLRRTRSDSPQLIDSNPSEDGDGSAASFEQEFNTSWLKQETIDSPQTPQSH